MENPFVENPIILNVVDISGFSDRAEKIKQQVIWINTNDLNVENMWKTQNVKKLKDRYGAKINSLKIIGGDEIDEDDDEDDVIDGVDIGFEDDEINDILNDDLDTISVAKEKNKILVDKPHIFVNDIFILPEDKISEFKKKIYTATQIPPYRQHLWYKHKNRVYPCSYNITHYRQLRINIEDLHKHTKFYEGLPVDMDLYNYKHEMNVSMLDEFQLLGHIYYTHGVTKYYVADLNDFIDPVRGGLESMIKKDRYSIELIYYSFVMKYWPQLTLSVFSEYLKNESILNEKYPDLAPGLSSTREIYKKETMLIGKNYIPEVDVSKWKIPIHLSVTYSVISVTESAMSNMTVYLRNLFDAFELSENNNFIICNMEIEGRSVIVKKSYKHTQIPALTPPVNNLLINVKIPDFGNTMLIINKKGYYNIESSWREEQYLDFNAIYNLTKVWVRPIIERINNFGKSICSRPLLSLHKDNTVFTNINSSIFWKNSISAAGFQEFKKILDSYVDAGIMLKNTTSITESHNFYFSKGMFKYDMKKYQLLNTSQNQYQYLVDSAIKTRHDKLTTRRKRINITHRFSDIKVDCFGIREQEYTSLYIYVLRLFESIPVTKESRIIKPEKLLKQLKEKDPILYDIKKIYGVDMVYSKLCQKRKQPVMHTEPGKNRVKFWNYTTGEPAYYYCPNPDYPFINFITGMHPKGFCIPCCYKLPPSKNEADKKNTIYNKCMTEKEYIKHQKNISRSRYIMGYGKDVEVGRLSKLPEHTLEPLFYDTFSASITGIDDECIKDLGYYVYGVSQHIKNVSNIGALFSIAHAVGKNIIRFVSESIDKINASDHWNVLMSGSIQSYFKSRKDLTEEMKQVFIGDKISMFEKWNELFISITKIFWDIEVVQFVDNYLQSPGDIYLRLSGNINHFVEIMSKKPHILLIEKLQRFNPIYLIKKDDFFKNGSIYKKIYISEDSVIEKIYNVFKHHLSSSTAKLDIDLYLIKEFIGKYPKYVFKTAFVNSSDKCWGVLLKKNKPFFIPLVESHYQSHGVSISFSTPNSFPSFKDMFDYVSDMNMFIKNRITDERVAYNPIVVENWLLYGKEVIGFKCGSINYTMEPISINTAIKTHNVQMIRMLYNPNDINEQLYKKLAPVQDTRSKKIASTMYNHYLYHILILELMHVMDKQRNTTMRTAIENIVKSVTINNNGLDKLRKLLEDYPEDYMLIRKLIVNNLMVRPETKKKKIFDNLITKKPLDVSGVLRVVETSLFNFDKKLFTQLKNMKYPELIEKLKTIFSKITHPEVPQLDAFPNVLSNCSSDGPYCKNKKLMISNDKLDTLIKILAADILNPIKAKYIFSPMFVKNIVDYFHFTKREHEHIHVVL
jgi:hypothetical protein